MLNSDLEEEEDKTIRAILVKEEAWLDYCRCSSYCGDTSRYIIEIIEGATQEEVISKAVTLVPNHDGSSRPDEDPSLYIITGNLSYELGIAFKERVLREREEKKAKEEAKLLAEKEAKRRERVETLRKEIEEIRSGDVLSKKVAALQDLESKIGG